MLYAQSLPTAWCSCNITSLSNQNRVSWQGWQLQRALGVCVAALMYMLSVSWPFDLQATMLGQSHQQALLEGDAII